MRGAGRRHGAAKAHLEFRPGFIRTGQPQLAEVDAGNLAGEVQTKTVAGNIFADGAAMKTLENMLPHRGSDGAAGIRHGEKHRVAIVASRDPDSAAGGIVLARVFEKI